MRETALLDRRTTGRDGSSGAAATVARSTASDTKVTGSAIAFPDFILIFFLQDVINEENFGVGVTRLGSSAVASTGFVPLLSPPGLSIYGSIDVLTNSTFLSVAGEGSQDGDYAVVQWDLSGNAKIVAKLTNAHEAVKFGPISTSLNPEKTQFAAVTTTRNLLGDKYDRWGIALLSLGSFAVTQHDLSPWMIAETDSVAGAGFLLPQSRGLR